MKKLSGKGYITTGDPEAFKFTYKRIRQSKKDRIRARRGIAKGMQRDAERLAKAIIVYRPKP